MVALELGKTNLAGEAGTYAKRLIGEGYGTGQGLAELDVEGLVDAGRDAKRGCKTPNVEGVSKVHAFPWRMSFEKWRRFWEWLGQWNWGLGGYYRLGVDGGVVRDRGVEGRCRGCCECD